MNYEQRYNEILQKAKEEYNRLGKLGNESMKRRFEIIFPELAESKDERIRKEMLDYFKDKKERLHYLCFECGDVKNAPFSEAKQIDDFLAYLEKQKEQKPILEVFGFKVGDAVRLKDGDGRKHIIKSFEEVEGLHGPNFYHVEFEDNSARDGIYPGEEYPNGYYTQMEKFEEEQKPVEWRPFDKEVLTKIKELIDSHFSEHEQREVYKDWLSEHISQPAEWSEEDENYLEEIIDDLKFCKKNRQSCKNGLIEDCINWLNNRIKFLRPKTPWKPSDEQLEQLKLSAIVGPEERRKILDSLYEQLKKL